jgi:hypothetical protein
MAASNLLRIVLMAKTFNSTRRKQDIRQDI